MKRKPRHWKLIRWYRHDVSQSPWPVRNIYPPGHDRYSVNGNWNSKLCKADKELVRKNEDAISKYFDVRAKSGRIKSVHLHPTKGWKLNSSWNPLKHEKRRRG